MEGVRWERAAVKLSCGCVRRAACCLPRVLRDSQRAWARCKSPTRDNGAVAEEARG